MSNHQEPCPTCGLLISSAETGQKCECVADGSSTVLETVLAERRDHLSERKDHRAEQYEDLAQKHRQQSDAHYQASHQAGEDIPMGQPILAGHHSEKRHRRAIDRINGNMRKSIEHDKTAKYYAEKLAAMEANTAISSDDPDALEKLQAKLADCEEVQEYMKSVNALVRKALKLPEAERSTKLAEWAKVSPDRATALLTPKYGHVGFPSFRLTNNGANMRRIKQRIEEIKAQHAEIVENGESAETEYPELKLTLVLNRTINRVQLVFKGKPDSAVREIIKSHGFRWSPSECTWQRQLNSNGEYAAQTVINQLKSQLRE